VCNPDLAAKPCLPQLAVVDIAWQPMQATTTRFPLAVLPSFCLLFKRLEGSRLGCVDFISYSGHKGSTWPLRVLIAEGVPRVLANGNFVEVLWPTALNF